MRALGYGALVLLLVIAAGFLAQRLFGSASEHPLSEAREAIEGMPYPVSVTEGPSDALVGSVRGRNQIVHFVVAKTPGGIDWAETPAGRAAKPRAAGPFWLWDDAERGRSRQTGVEREERAELAGELEEAICRKATGNACAA